MLDSTPLLFEPNNQNLRLNLSSHNEQDLKLNNLVDFSNLAIKGDLMMAYLNTAQQSKYHQLKIDKHHLKRILIDFRFR